MERKEKEIRRKRKWKRNQAQHADQSADLREEEVKFGGSEVAGPVLSVRAGLEGMLRRLRYRNLKTHSVLSMRRSDIQNLERILRPPTSVSDNPSFPELAFSYLPFDICTTDAQGQPYQELTMRHYLLLRLFCFLNFEFLKWLGKTGNN